MNFSEKFLDNLSHQDIKSSIHKTYNNVKFSELKNLIIYGLSKEANDFFKECISKNIVVDKIVDDYKKGYFNKINIQNKINLDDYNDQWIIICTHRFASVYWKLKKMGLKKVIPLWALQILFSSKFKPHENYKGWINEIIKNKKNYFVTENLFKDKKSRLSWENYIKFKITFDPIYIFKSAQIMTTSFELDAGRDTFPKDISLPIKDDEIFIDGGAWNGDTIEKFILHNNHYKKIYGDREDTSSLFVSKKSATTKSVQVTTIDDLNLKQQNVTIKLNVEGYENKAIQGAKKTILNNNVNFIICLNHKNKDLTELPLLINQINKRFKFYFRIVDYGINGLVLFVKRL